MREKNVLHKGRHQSSIVVEVGGSSYHHKKGSSWRKEGAPVLSGLTEEDAKRAQRRHMGRGL